MAPSQNESARQADQGSGREFAAAAADLVEAGFKPARIQQRRVLPRHNWGTYFFKMVPKMFLTFGRGKRSLRTSDARRP
jgi:hypothetical protein